MTSRLPLRFAIVAPFLLQILLTSGLVGYLSLRHGTQAVHQIADDLRSEINTHVAGELEHFFATPLQINQLNADAIRLGWLDAADQAMLEAHFLQQVQIFKSVSSIYFGNTQGGLANAGREGPDGALYLIATDGFQRGAFRKFAVDSAGRRTALLTTIPNFDASSRLWYQGAVSKGGVNWSEVYILFTGQDMAIAVSQPAVDVQGRLLGVVSVDLFLAQLSDFLKALEIGESGQSYIVERSGLLIASSANGNLFLPQDGEAAARRLLAEESASPLIRGAAQELNSLPGGLAAIQAAQRFEFRVDGERQYGEILPVAEHFGVDWLIVTVIPEADFMAQIRASGRLTILMMVIAAAMTILLDIAVARWISLPIQRLSAAAKGLAGGEWAQAALPAGTISEVGELTGVFTHMAGQLQQSLDGLRDSEERLGLALHGGGLGLWDWDTQTGAVTYNQRWAEMLGLSLENIAPTLQTWQERVHPDDWAVITPALNAHLEGQTPFYESEHRILHVSGDWIWVLVRGRVIQRDAQGRPLRVCGTHLDITERKEATELLQMQRDLGLRLGAAHDLEAALQVILDAALRVQGVECGGIYLVDQDSGAVDLVAHRGLSQEFVQHAAHYTADSPNARRIASGEPLFAYYPRDASDKSPWSLKEGLRMLAVIPVMHNGKPIAAINLASRTVDEIPVSSRRALETIAAQVGAIVARMQMDRALRSSQHNLQTLFDTQQDFIFILDMEWKILLTNPAVEKRLGYSREELAGMSALMVHPPEQREEAAAITAEIAAGRREICSIPLFTKSGEIIPVETRVAHTLWNGQKALIGVSRDTSERLQAESLQTALYKISEAASETQELSDLYAKVHEIIRGLMPANNLYLALFDREINAWRFPYHIDEYDENPGVMLPGRSLTDYVLRSGESLLADPETFAALAAQGEVESVGAPSVDWLGVPLKTADQTALGVMVVQSYTEGLRYQGRDRYILEYVSTQIAIAIQRKQIEAAEKEQRALAVALLESATALNSTLDIEALYEIILVHLGKFVSYDSANIMILEGDVTRIVHQHGRPSCLKWQEQRFEAGNYAMMHETIHTLKPSIIPDTQAHPHWVNTPGGEWIRSYAGVPLRVQQKAIGRLGLDSARVNAFSAEDIAKLQAFADQAALAIENARLYAEVQRLAVMDELTGVYNRRGLFALGQREVDRAARFGRPLAALFLDLDHFKLFNDRYSYQVGDRVLRLAADCIRDNLREVDLIGRYGGEEFVVLLPETDRPAAEEIAERLRRAVASVRLHTAQGELSVEVSIGGCGNCAGVKDMETMIAKAASALQAAKKAGRNRVIFKGAEG